MRQLSANDLKSLWKNVCRDNDLKAYEQLFYHLNRHLIHFCDALLNNTFAAEEIVSDAFIYLWNNRQNLHHIENPKSYLYTTVKNKSINHLKKFSHLRLHDDLSAGLPLRDPSDPNLLLEQKEFFRQMDNIIVRLPRQTRLVFSLIKDSGMKYQEVAAILQISPRTVQTHMRRALRKISALLQEHRQAEDQLLFNKLISLVCLFDFL